MKITFVINRLSWPGGGAERVLSVVGSELAARGHQVEIASFDPPGTEDFYAIDSRVVRHRLGTGRLRGMGALRSLIRARRPDVAVGFMHTGFMPLAIAAAGSGIPPVASEHTVFAHYRTRLVLPILLCAFAPRFDAITVPTEKARDGYPQAIRRRMAVVPNPVLLTAAPRPRREEKALFIILAVGNLRREKGHATLIEAFARLAKDYAQWHLHIAGDGPERQSLEGRTQRLKLGSRVKLLGPVRDIADVYGKADIFVMPSVYESFGLATAEALAAGVPAIGFADCPGTNEIIQHGQNGLLVTGPDRAEALAGGLREMMDSADLRSRLAAAAPGSLKCHSVEEIAELWEDLLSGVAGGAARVI